MLENTDPASVWLARGSHFQCKLGWTCLKKENKIKQTQTGNETGKMISLLFIQLGHLLFSPPWMISVLQTIHYFSLVLLQPYFHCRTFHFSLVHWKICFEINFNKYKNTSSPMSWLCFTICSIIFFLNFVQLMVNVTYTEGLSKKRIRFFFIVNLKN